VDVRFICATHRDLRELVKEGRFREDLYYRLSAFVLEVPPLRARSDFDTLLEALLAEAGCEPQRLDAKLRCYLKSSPWPGNVRQLRHALRLALALADADEPLGRHHFHFEERASPLASDAPSVAAHGDELSWERAQQAAIAAALQRAGGNVTAAAALLGMGRSTLYRKLGK